MVRVMTALILAGTLILGYGAAYADDDEESNGEDCAEVWGECVEDAVKDYEDCVEDCDVDDDDGGSVNERSDCVASCDCTRGGVLSTCNCDAINAGCLEPLFQGCLVQKFCFIEPGPQ